MCSSFTASRLSNDVLFPDRIDIDNDTVIYYKGALIGYTSLVVRKNQISSVRMRYGIIFGDIIIETSGGQHIVLHGFYKNDAKMIMALLKQ